MIFHKHNWRFEREIKYQKERIFIFYCTKCLKENVKWGDMDIKELFEWHKKNNPEWFKKRAKRIKYKK